MDGWQFLAVTLSCQDDVLESEDDEEEALEDRVRDLFDSLQAMFLLEDGHGAKDFQSVVKKAGPSKVV